MKIKILSKNIQKIFSVLSVIISMKKIGEKWKTFSVESFFLQVCQSFDTEKMNSKGSQVYSPPF